MASILVPLDNQIKIPAMPLVRKYNLQRGWKRRARLCRRHCAKCNLTGESLLRCFSVFHGLGSAPGIGDLESAVNYQLSIVPCCTRSTE
jgi:hypothetical protein